jgi:hypothetical protein
MADRIAWLPHEVPRTRLRTPESLRYPGLHRPSGENAEHLRTRVIPTERIASPSPLRNLDTNRVSPVKNRPVLRSSANSIASRSSSIPPNALDEIPEEKWARMASIRTANTPEISNPDLSIDEITSTKLSLDDQAILADLPQELERKETQARRFLARTLLGDKSKENNGRFKRMTSRIKKIPSGLFNRKDRRWRETSSPTATQATSPSQPSLPQLNLTTELCIPDPCTTLKDANTPESKPTPLVCVSLPDKGRLC